MPVRQSGPGWSSTSWWPTSGSSMVGVDAQPQRGVVVGQVSYLHLCLDRTHYLDAVPAQQSASDQVIELRHRLMPGPQPLMVGHQLSLAPHLDPAQISAGLDRPTDHRWIDRVIVAVKAQV